MGLRGGRGLWRLWRSGPACWRVCIGLQAGLLRAGGIWRGGRLAGGVWRGGETDKYFAAFRGEIEMILFRFFFYRCMNESPHFPQFPGRMAGARAAPAKPRSLPHCLAKLWEMVFLIFSVFSGLLPFSFPTPDIPLHSFLSGVALSVLPGRIGRVYLLFLISWQKFWKTFFLCRSIARFLHPYRVWMMFAFRFAIYCKCFCGAWRLCSFATQWRFAVGIFSQCCVGGFLCRQPGVVSYRMGVSDDVIFYCSGLVGSFAHFAFNWVFAFWRGFFSVYLKSGRTTLMTALIIVNAKNSRSWYFRAISSSVVLMYFRR